MTDIEEKALALVNEVRAEARLGPTTPYEQGNVYAFKALCRAIEQHEAFRQEVSDVVESCIMRLSKGRDGLTAQTLARFILAKPDPLVEAIAEWRRIPGSLVEDNSTKEETLRRSVEVFRVVLAKRGLEVTEINKEQN